MTDDPAAVPPEPTAAMAEGDLEPLAQSYIQITEAEAGLIGAADLLERRDAYGRVPLVVRIRAQPPIRVELVLLAIALGASGVLLPLFLALKAVIIVAAVVMLFVGLVARIFIRVPPGAAGIVIQGGRPAGVLTEGIHRVSPFLALTHLVSLRQLAFDVPVTEVRSADGVGVSVDTLLTLAVSDPQKLVYSVSTSDLDQLVHATCQDAVRKLIRETDALRTLDLGGEDADRLRAIIDERLAPFGLDVPAVAFTRITLPMELTASLEARRLASVRLAEQTERTALDQRRIADQARLEADEQEGRRAAVEKAAAVEELRLERLEARLAAYPAAARYDLELARLRVAERAAGNTRAIVSLGGSDVGRNLVLAMEPGAGEPEEAAPAVPAGTDDAAPAATGRSRSRGGPTA